MLFKAACTAEDAKAHFPPTSRNRQGQLCLAKQVLLCCRQGNKLQCSTAGLLVALTASAGLSYAASPLTAEAEAEAPKVCLQVSLLPCIAARQLQPCWSSHIQNQHSPLLRQTVDQVPQPAGSPRSSGQRPDITLYQYEVCPFCCKVKAFLDYHKVRKRQCLLHL